MLGLEVGEGDVWAGEAAVLLTVAPVNLQETHGEPGPVQQALWGPLSRPPPPGSLQFFIPPSLYSFPQQAITDADPTPRFEDGPVTRTLP